MQRREFLGTALATAVGGGAATEPAVPAIDTHTHFYDPTRPQGVPWPGRDDRLLYRRVLPDDFTRLARPHGVAGTVVVEASPWVEDNAWLLDLAVRYPTIRGVVGRLLPESDDFGRHLDRFARDRRFRGIRITHDELRQGLDRGRFHDAMARLAQHDLVLDVNGGPDLPADVARLARRHRDLRVVINHAANVRADGKAVPRAWRRGMAEAAEHRNVACKVSALVEGTGRTAGDAPRDVAFYLPVLDALWDRFGEDRLLYGSNWPVSERFASYATVFRLVDEYARGKGRAAREKVLARNAAAVYRWPAR